MERAKAKVMRYVTAIAIGPVQDFIASARRCRDLWYGSQLLSELSKAAARALQERKATLIVPAPRNPEDLKPGSRLTVANKLLASVETDDIGGLIRQTREEVQKRLVEVADLRRMNLHGLEIKEEAFWRQLDTLLEFYAAWVKEGEYKSSRSRVEELLAARKTLRNFPAYQGAEGEYKSSLDGAREQVIEKRSEELYESNLKDNEYLDAIGIVKRFAGGPPRFNSTVDVAAVPFVKGIERAPEKRRQAWRKYQHFVQRYKMPERTYSLLYDHESRQLFQENEAANEELKEIRKELSKPNPPYYALLLGDGDKIGSAISALQTPESHQELSEVLSEFAAEARELTDSEEYGGCSIYCGGDDVLCLLPLHTAVRCAMKINELFRERLKEYGVTFSAGLVVAHGLEQLTEVREWAAEAEHTAKTEGNRDTLCISVHAQRSTGHYLR